MKPLAALLVGLLVATGSQAARAQVDPEAPPLCDATISLEPARVVPGQQVLYRLRLLVRSEVSDVAWEEPPAFPGLRSERLGVHSLAEPSLRNGVLYELREDARALFAERTGRVVLPSARLACRMPGGQGASVATPEAVLEVVPQPEAALAAGTGGLVGPLDLRSSVTPRRVALGQSVRIAVTLRGEGNLWDAAPPELSSERLGGAEVFQRRDELLLERGTRLVVRRHFAIDVVPRREGLLRIPSLAWSTFDPVTGRTAAASTEPIDVLVGPPDAIRAESQAAPPERAEPAAGPAAPSPPGVLAGWLGAGLLLLGGVAVACWRVHRRRQRVARAVSDALARANAARDTSDRDGELAALSRALRTWLLPELGAAAEGDAEEILASDPSPRARAAVELLAQLERARFDRDTAPPERDAVLRVLGRPDLRENGCSEEEGG